MSKGRLTRQELSWLLTQEAQNAAERLRVGVQVLRTSTPSSPPPPPESSPLTVREAHLLPDPTFDSVHHVDASLDALDDVMKMLSNLNARQSSSQQAAAPRRGRIDLAALIVEVAPDARLSIEPGSGTEVFGDEADFRRMIQVLIGHGGGEGASVVVRRDHDDVHISTTLGPEISPTAATERAWLSRMAVRYGGRTELEGGTESLILPAEQSSDKERESLRRELDEARKQGEVYARELAAVFERGEEVTSATSVPPAPTVPAAERFATITKVCAGVASEIRAALGPLGRELQTLRRHEVTEEGLDTFRRRVAHTHELLAALRSIGSVPPFELATEIDLVDAAKSASRDGNDSGERRNVKVTVRETEPGRPVYVRAGKHAVAALARELVAHAVAASPKDAVVDVAVSGGDDAGGPRLVVDDAGSALPASGRRAFLALEVHAGQYGRPSALPIFMAAELATAIGARLELSDAPTGGVRVTVTFST